jgi:lysophospholipase L1-like esterase
MRTILCYGDSNTWGYEPRTGRRLDRGVRWPGRLQASLGEEWHVVEEGLNGRTTCLESVLAAGKNGLTYLIPCLESHAPLDAVVIFLGTNDLANQYGMEASDIARAAGRLATTVRDSAAGPDGGHPLPVLICPPPLGDMSWPDDWSRAPEKAELLPARFASVAEELGIELIQLGPGTRYSAIDGIHLDADGHAEIARLVDAKLRDLLG